MSISQRIAYQFLAVIFLTSLATTNYAQQWEGPGNTNGPISRSGQVTVGEPVPGGNGPKALVEVTRPLGSADDRNDRLFSANNLYKGDVSPRFEVDTRHAYAGGARSKLDILPPDVDFAVHRRAAIGVSSMNERVPGDYTLVVGGKILAEEVRIKLMKDWSDYVFDARYPLPPLPEVERFIQTHRHLPAIPSAADVEQEGISLGQMQSQLLMKIEELTLYVIEQHKAIERLERKLAETERAHDLPEATIQR